MGSTVTQTHIKATGGLNMSTRQSIERQQLEHERRESDRERTMARRFGRCAKHIKATGSVTRAGHIRDLGE